MLSKNYSNTVLNAFPPIVFFPSILMSLLCLLCVIDLRYVFLLSVAPDFGATEEIKDYSIVRDYHGMWQNSEVQVECGEAVYQCLGQ